MFEELTLPFPRSATLPDIGTDLSALVDLYAPTLFRVAHALLRNRAEAEDVVQDTFVRVLEKQRELSGIRELRPWLIRITWNLALDRRRRKTPSQADDLFLQSLASSQTPIDEVLRDAEQNRLVLDAIDRLPKPERQALLLSAIDELSTAEVASIMGKSESAIRSLLHRARTQLRQRLQARLVKGEAR